MKSFIISHLKFVIIITCIATTIIIGILTFSVIKSKKNVTMQSKEPTSQVIANLYKNEL